MSSLIEQIDELEPGILRVYRDSEDDIGFREAVMYVDGTEVGWVDYKHVLEVPVRPGHHSLRSFNRILHSKTLEFDIKPGERLTFQVANVGGAFFKLFMMICMGVPGMRLTQESSNDIDSSLQRVHTAKRKA